MGVYIHRFGCFGTSGVFSVQVSGDVHFLNGMYPESYVISSA